MPLRAQQILYLTTDSVVGGLGQAQIWSYLSRLTGPNRQFTVISWEPGRRDQPVWQVPSEARLAGEAQRLNIQWLPLRRTRWVGRVGVVWDGFRTLVLALGVVLSKRIQIVHARSDIAMAIGWVVRGFAGCRTIYDMRGFWADERLDGGLWCEGPLYRFVRALEERLVRHADAVVVLTQAAAARLSGMCPRHRLTVIPTGVDLGRFAVAGPGPWSAASGWTMLYSGSLGTWQGLEGLGGFFRAVLRLRPASRLIVVTPQPKEEWYGRLVGADLPPDRVVAEIDPPPGRMAALIAEADVGVAFYRRTRSAAGCAPVKLSEYLASGLPVVVSPGIGDCDAWVVREQVGVIAHQDRWDAVVASLERLLADPAIAQRCRAAAERLFSVDRGVERYAALYVQLLGRP